MVARRSDHRLARAAGIASADARGDRRPGVARTLLSRALVRNSPTHQFGDSRSDPPSADRRPPANRRVLSAARRRPARPGGRPAGARLRARAAQPLPASTGVEALPGGRAAVRRPMSPCSRSGAVPLALATASADRSRAVRAGARGRTRPSRPRLRGGARPGLRPNTRPAHLRAEQHRDEWRHLRCNNRRRTPGIVEARPSSAMSSTSFASGCGIHREARATEGRRRCS